MGGRIECEGREREVKESRRPVKQQTGFQRSVSMVTCLLLALCGMLMRLVFLSSQSGVEDRLRSEPWM